MEPITILLIVLLVITGIYLFIIILDLIFVLVFRKIFIQHDTAIKVMLTNKYQTLNELIDYLNSKNVVIEFRVIKALQDIDVKCFANQTSAECKNAKDAMNLIRDQLYLSSRSNIDSINIDEFNEFKDTITEIDNNYRSLAQMYNSDVLGYNYWIHFMPTRYIYLIFKTKDKEMI